MKQNYFTRGIVFDEKGGIKLQWWQAVLILAVIIGGIIATVWIVGSMTQWFGLVAYKGNIELTVKLRGEYPGLNLVDMTTDIRDSSGSQIYTSTIRAPTYQETYLNLNPGAEQTLYLRVASTTTTRWYSILLESTITGAVLGNFVKIGTYYYIEIKECSASVVLDLNVAPEAELDIDSYNDHLWTSSIFTVSSVFNITTPLSVIYKPQIIIASNESFETLNVTRITTPDGYVVPVFNSTDNCYYADFPVTWLENPTLDPLSYDVIVHFKGTLNSSVFEITNTIRYRDFNMAYRTALSYDYLIFD